MKNYIIAIIGIGLCLTLTACKTLFGHPTDGDNMERDYLETVNRICYSEAGSSTGGYESITLLRNDDNTYQLAYEYLEANGVELITKELNDSAKLQAVFERVKDIIKNYDATSWKDYPKSDLVALDASVTGVTIFIENEIITISDSIELKNVNDYAFFAEVHNALMSVLE